jgi:CP family cyanate transporter-like MFS transporter
LQGRVLALVAIVLLAFSLRSAVASLSPVLDYINADLSMPASVAGLIGTAPPVCFALFGLITPALERRFGLQQLTTMAIALVAVATIGRALAPNAPLLLLGTALIFAGIAVANVLMPPLVKTYFPEHLGLLTTIYMTVMSVSTFLPPLVAVPVSDAANWRVSLGMWAVMSVIALIPWVGMSLRARRTSADDLEEPSPSVFGRVARLPLAWAMAVAFAASSATAYTSFMWLPTLLVDSAGVSPAGAGALLSLFAAMGLPASLAVPLIVARYRRVGLLFALAVACGIAGAAGLLFVPSHATWLWVALFGSGPLLFPLVLLLVGMRTRTHAASVALSGFVQSGGYAIAAATPLLAGVLHDATGGWTATLIMLLVLYLAVIPAAVVIVRPHTVEDEWERRHGTW